MARPLDDLKAMLLNDCVGKRMIFKELYESHSVGKPYTDSNYKQVLKGLEKDAVITVDRPGMKRRKGTFADDVVIAFQPRGD